VNLPTKGKARIKDIGPGSKWQCGPKELSYRREKWPATREFKRSLPEEELRLKSEGVCNVMVSWPRIQLMKLRAVPNSGFPPSGGLDNHPSQYPSYHTYTVACGDGELVRNLCTTVQRCLSYSNCLEVCIRVLARVVNAFSKGRNVTYEEPDIESRIRSRKLIDLVSSFDVTDRVKKLTELDPYLVYSTLQVE